MQCNVPTHIDYIECSNELYCISDIPSSQVNPKLKMASSSSSHPKYSEMIIEAIQVNKADGNMNTSRQAILKFITSKYGIESQLASTSIKKNLKTMLESEVIKQAAADGKKGAGSFRYGLVLHLSNYFVN